jgi:hypothetical protein
MRSLLHRIAIDVTYALLAGGGLVAAALLIITGALHAWAPRRSRHADQAASRSRVRFDHHHRAHPAARARLAGTLASLALALAGQPAHADEPPSPPRALPDYDGRGPAPATLGDGLLWIPRVILFPGYLVTEYLIREPIGAFETYAELHGWPHALYDFFTWDGKAGIVPFAYIEFGLSPSVGVYVFADDVFLDGNDLRGRLGFWGSNWLGLSLTDRVALAPGTSLALSTSWAKRPDRVFYGLGPDSRDALHSSFADSRHDTSLALSSAPSSHLAVHAAVGIRSESYSDGDTELADRIAAGQLPAPPGWDDPYTIAYERVSISADSRSPLHMTGGRVELRGETAFETNATEARWIRWGGAVGASVDVTGHQRVISLGVDVDFADPIGSSAPVPFLEQVAFGGEGQMRGFGGGRLVDRSGVAATLSYNWPVWAFLDGSTFFSVGNVFGAHLDGLAAGELRMAAGLGLRTTGSPDNGFEILFGLGTDTFHDGAGITSVRFVIGAHHGF